MIQEVGLIGHHQCPLPVSSPYTSISVGGMDTEFCARHRQWNKWAHITDADEGQWALCAWAKWAGLAGSG